MQIIEQNPYRQLGVFANSPTRERVANHNRLKAFLKVGKQVSFPLDLSQHLPAIERTAESVANAEAKLTLPKDQLKYGQFWFVKSTPIDNIAFNHLFAGNLDGAISLWGRKDDASSLQNRTLCYLIKGEYESALICAQKLYADFIDQFVSLVLGDGSNVTTDELPHDFLDTICEEVGSGNMLRYLETVPGTEWKEYVGKATIAPIIQKIQDAISTAKGRKGKGPAECLAAGKKLMSTTKPLLAQLQKLLPKTDLQYQMIADKLGLEILQCGIDYYNASDEPDCATKAMQLQEYALKVVVGKMAKDRCQENVNILKKIIAELPPAEIYNECKAIEKILSDAVKGSNTIYAAKSLLNNAKPHLQAMRNKVGKSNGDYLKLSTLVVNIALSKVIEAVNEAQKDVRVVILHDLDELKSVIRNAWEVTLMMDDFDMEYEFKTKRYNPNRRTLQNIKDQITAIHTGGRGTSSTSTSSGSGCMVLISLFFVLIAGCAIISCTNSSRKAPASTQSDEVELTTTTTGDDHSEYVSDNDQIMLNENLSDDLEKTYTRLETGAKPYADYYGKAANGDNYLDFKTSGDDDYVVIIKYYGSDRVADHMYICGGDQARVWLPNSRYSIYFYSGRDWDSEKIKGDVKGGFAHRESLQKDEPVELYNMYGEYTLYPVYDGNLQLQGASTDEVFEDDN